MPTQRSYSEYLIGALTSKTEAIAYIQAVSSDGSEAEIELCLANCRAAHPDLAGLDCAAAIKFLANG
jgi:hypothetical protein